LFGKISYYDEKGKLEKIEEYDLQGNLIKKWKWKLKAKEKF
jgi:hypothetical protein